MPWVTTGTGFSSTLIPGLSQTPSPLRSLPHQAQKQRARFEYLVPLPIVISSRRLPRLLCPDHLRASRSVALRVSCNLKGYPVTCLSPKQ
jgi:hypothetical protein